MLNHTVIEIKDNNALVFTDLKDPTPYIIALGYDSENCTWRQGIYFDNLFEAVKEFHTEVIGTTTREIIAVNEILWRNNHKQRN